MTTIQPSIKHNLQLVRLCVTLFILTLGGTLSYTQSIPVTWTGNIDADWHKAGNWSPMTIPNDADSVVINGFISAESPRVLSDSLAEAKSVTIASGATLTIDGMGVLDIENSAKIGITNAGLLLIRPNGIIRVDSSGHTHIDNMASGVINNEGEIILGGQSTFRGTKIGITSGGDINNLSTGTILIEGLLDDGIVLTNDATLTNEGNIDFAITTYFLGNGIVIEPDAMVVNKNIINTGLISGFSGPDLNGIYIDGALHNEAGGSIKINAAYSGNGVNITSSGNLKNDGELILGESNIAKDGIISNGILTNNGSIELRLISGAGIKNLSTVTNNDTASITSTQSISPVIYNMNTFDNYGLIDLQIGTFESITNSGNNTAFTNREGATINILSGKISNESLAIFNNNTCAKIKVNGGFLSNTSLFNNDGFLLLENPSSQQISGNLINNGLISTDQSSFPLGSITDNEIILLGPSTGNLCNSVTPLFSNAPSNLSIDNIYLDQAGTIMDGAYDPSTNTYTTSAANPFSFGSQTRYIEISGMGGNCTIIVPWVIEVTNCACNSPCFDQVDKCWTPIGNDKSWSNGNNWMPVGVPQTEDWVEIPSCTEVEYDYSGSAIIARVDVKSDAKMTVMQDKTIKIQSKPNCTFCSLFINSGEFTNKGTIDLLKTPLNGLFNFNKFDNYGSIIIDSVNVTNQSPGSTGFSNEGDFNNFSGASITLKNSLANGFQNSGDFINHSGANITVHDITNTGMDLRFGSTFENKSGGIIDVYNINNPSDKLIIRLGAEVIWNLSVDIQN